MKLYKNIIYLFILCLYSYFTVQMNSGTDFISLYKGVIFDSRIIFVLIEFLMFACYSLYIYNEFETYIYEYGVYVVVREKSRRKVFARLLFKLLSFILLIEAAKIWVFSCFMSIMRGQITMSDPFETLKIFVVRLCIYILIFLIQMMLELYFTGKVALIATLLYYLFNVGLGSIIYNIKSFVNVCLLPNLSMKSRLDVLAKEYNLSYPVISLSFVLLIVITLIVSQRFFTKKDIF